MRLVSVMVIGQPRLMHHSRPGEMSPFSLSMFSDVILSPGATSARAGPCATASAAIAASASHQRSVFTMVASPSVEGAWLAWSYTGLAPPVNYCDPRLRLGSGGEREWSAGGV